LALEIIIKTRKRLLPLIITIIISLCFSILGLYSGFFNFSTAFIPEGQGGIDPLIGLINALILIIIAASGAFLIYLLLKHNKEMFLKYFFFITFFLISGFMLFLFGLSILNLFPYVDLIHFILVIVISFITGFIISLMIFFEKFYKKLIVKNIGLLVFGALVGSFLGLVLPIWTSLLLLVGLSIYDIFAVFKGPIKKIVELNEKRNNNFLKMSYSMPDYEIGLGDLTFYSMLACLSLKIGFDTPFINEFGVIGVFLPCICSIIGIILGAILTFKLLEKREMLPGLPISIGLGLVFFGISILIFWII